MGARANTGLGRFGELCAAVADAAAASADGVTAVFVDIGEVATANLAFGRDGGNAVIEGQADRLVAVAAPNSVFHLGGDRFVALVVGDTLDVRVERARQLIEAVTRSLGAPILFGDVELPTTADAWVLSLDTNASADDDLLAHVAEAEGRAWARVYSLARDRFAGARSLDELASMVATDGVERLALLGVRACIHGHEARAGTIPSRSPDGHPIVAPEVRVEWWAAGSVDFPSSLSQPINAALAAAVNVLVATERERALGETDPLTGLLNRRGLTRATRVLSGPFTVVLVDLDRLKHINDSHGHDAGDRALCRVAGLLLEGRQTDIVARWGGEEFVVVLPDTDPDGAAAWLRRLIETSRATSEPMQEVTFSAGVARCVEPADLVATVSRADEALYEAKRAGRARVVIA